MNGAFIGSESAVDWQLFGVVVFALLMFGISYNLFVAHLGEKSFGYTSLLVVAGTLVTLGAALFLMPLVYVLIMLGLFGASGLPMVIGEIVRAVREREAAIKAMQSEVQYVKEKAASIRGEMGSATGSGSKQRGNSCIGAGD